MMSGSSLPLSQSWCMWTSKWKGKPNLQFLTRFDTVQSFWMNFNSTPPTSLPDKAYLHIFREGISPLWEDPHNVAGGHFKLTTHSQESSLRMWQSIVLHLIGGMLPTGQRINGVSFVLHTVGNNLIKVWVASSDKDAVESTRAALTSILDPSDYLSDKVTFVPHKLVLPSKPRQTDQGSAHSSPVGGKITKRKKSTDSTGSNEIEKKKVETECCRLAVTEIKAPISCGPAQVRFAHDPYSLGGGCTYLTIPSEVAG
jgi:hypothetical protein